MSSYVLVHGAWFGSWCWERVVPLLQEQGHTVEAPDLPGYGQDRTPPREITLQSFVDRVCEAIDRQSEPVILVGHSRGGIVITQVAEQRPDRIGALVYVSGFLPRAGESLLHLAQQDRETAIFPNLTFVEDQGYIAFKDDAAAVKEVFCGDCADADIVAIKSRLMLEAFAPAVTPVQTTDEHFGRVPRVYIACLNDRAIGPSLQQQMYTATPCEQVITMNTSHSPFYAAPTVLAAHLHATSTMGSVAATASVP